MIFDQWDVVVVPFPFTDRNASKRRPAMVVTKENFNSSGRSVMAMITSTTEPWPGDHNVDDLKATGLRVACRVRLKLFTLENSLVLRRIGSLSENDRIKLARTWAQFGVRLR